MSWSLTEIRALSVKAARGAGFGPGLAEEAGWAVHWLSARGLPGVDGLANYLVAGILHAPVDLDRLTTGQAQDGGQTHCPIRLGTALTDSATVIQSAYPIAFGPVCQPLLLMPFAAQLNGDWVLEYGALRLPLSGAVATLVQRQGELLMASASCAMSLELGASKGAMNNPNSSSLPAARVPDSCGSGVAALERFAKLTYAPATSASRVAGAGAGIDDND